MDYETVSADAFGKSLRGIGLNLVVRDVLSLCETLEAVFDMKAHRKSADFAILTFKDQVFQLHSDAAYGDHPLYGLLPELGARGAGIEIRLYDTDPDEAVKRGEKAGMHLLQEPMAKAHGLREAYLVCENGYAWVPSLALT